MSSHPVNISPRVELVDDVKRMVLDYLSLYSDLQALCLTSKDWNPAATEYLYRKIVLDIRFRDGQLAAFRQCLHIGAQRHLIHTRSLNLLDVPRWEIGDFVPYWEPMDQATRDPLMLEVLQTFPRNKLREFRYVSEFDLQLDLNATIVGLLGKHQQSIDSLHVSRGDMRQLIYPKTRRITTGFHGKQAQTRGFMQFAEALPALESLSFLFPDGWTEDVHKYWHSGSYAFYPFHRQIVAREVSLEGCMPESFGSALPYVFDLSRVTKLALFNCKCELLRSLSSSSELRNLVYFELRTGDCFDDRVSEYARALFASNHSLQHLCLHISGLSTVSPVPQVIDQAVPPSDPSYSTPYLWPLRPMLRTLSLWDQHYITSLREWPSPRPSELRHICNEFSALEQLGLWLFNNYISAAEAERRDYETMRYLEPIGKLKNLKILHLYQDRIRVVPSSKPKVNTRNLQQRFATRLFQWAHECCPFLKVLIWGAYDEESLDYYSQIALQDEHEGRKHREFGVVERAPQQCFVKKAIKLDDGTLQITAARTTRSRIRNDFPELHILDYDTGCRVADRLADEAVRCAKNLVRSGK